MKNPFVKQNNSLALLVAGATGLAAAGAGVWYYIRNRRAAQLQAAYAHEHAQDYLEHPHKPKQRTDVHDLQNIVHHQQA